MDPVVGLWPLPCHTFPSLHCAGFTGATARHSICVVSFWRHVIIVCDCLSFWRLLEPGSAHVVEPRYQGPIYTCIDQSQVRLRSIAMFLSIFIASISWTKPSLSKIFFLFFFSVWSISHLHMMDDVLHFWEMSCRPSLYTSYVLDIISGTLSASAGAVQISPVKLHTMSFTNQ